MNFSDCSDIVLPFSAKLVFFMSLEIPSGLGYSGRLIVVECFRKFDRIS